MAGADRGNALAAGWQPRPQPAPIALAPGEVVLAQGAVRLDRLDRLDRLSRPAPVARGRCR
ncbi:hypothetical protein FF36_01759 [Frankia torreyi]|uniref:Uncharacterized protein n=1 Tax=Frankia torreyi TaxID=1856 RepID=A0A0D8BI76_9ACTN|nr:MULTISPECIES: hypothetical protein [Frankia]KJE23826.1 hypothetical protein FF36_01759 [Frankia torreyi]KQM05735.1 hypothetical protein FF86_101320 [Frankia sp. CpI1-P]